ncbi:hypothetical protein TWF481_006996 [Arthrobotrys musiformis]|uniref:F-box domain-containing protein n=1 Tax=Arthrobotrys musiformis TaxID=47236 RepID=A0AAV9WA50_9PEZI
MMFQCQYLAGLLQRIWARIWGRDTAPGPKASPEVKKTTRRDETEKPKKPPEGRKRRKGVFETLPQELIDKIVNDLSVDDINSLKATCSKLNHMAKRVLYQKLFTVRRYYWTVTDLKALVRFAKDISALDPSWQAKLKHLIIEVGSPCFNPELPKDGGPPKPMPHDPNSIPPDVESAFLSLLDLGHTCCSSKFRSRYMHLNHFHKAMSMLRDVKHLEIVGAGDHKKIPRKGSARNRTNVSKVLSELSRIKRKPGTNRYPPILSERYYPPIPQEVFANILATFSGHSYGLETLHYYWKTQTIEYVGIEWFSRWWEVGDAADLRPVVSGLTALTVNLQKPLNFVSNGSLGSEVPLTSYRETILRFLRCQTKLEDLHISFTGIDWSLKMRNERGQHRPYLSALLLDRLSAGMGHLPVLRKLHLDTVAFRGAALTDLLIDRKQTLQELRLTNCHLQDISQRWWHVFNALERLSLGYFQFECTHGEIFQTFSQHGFTYSREAIPWFRIYGDIKSRHHYCELWPNRLGEMMVNLERSWELRVEYRKALKAIRVWEDVIILRNRPRTHLGECVQALAENPQRVIGTRDLRFRVRGKVFPPWSYWQTITTGGASVSSSSWILAPSPAVPVDLRIIQYTLLRMLQIEECGWHFDDPIVGSQLLPREGVDG